MLTLLLLQRCVPSECGQCVPTTKMEWRTTVSWLRKTAGAGHNVCSATLMDLIRVIDRIVNKGPMMYSLCIDLTEKFNRTNDQRIAVPFCTHKQHAGLTVVYNYVHPACTYAVPMYMCFYVEWKGMIHSVTRFPWCPPLRQAQAHAHPARVRGQVMGCCPQRDCRNIRQREHGRHASRCCRADPISSVHVMSRPFRPIASSATYCYLLYLSDNARTCAHSSLRERCTIHHHCKHRPSPGCFFHGDLS